MSKFLFIRGGAVGDFILTMPSIELVRKNVRDVEIDILGYPSIAELAVSAGIADRVRSIEHASLAPFFAPGATLDPDMVKYLSSFHIVFSYLYDPDGYFEANLRKAKVETLFIGPYQMSEEEPFVPAAKQLAKPLQSLALYLEEPHSVYSYPKPDSSLSRQTNGPVVALHPGSGSASKNWSFESWIEVARGLQEKYPEIEFLIVSGEAEAGVIGEFVELFQSLKIPFQHLDSIPLSKLASHFQQSDYFLGHDSGISHLAASAGLEGLLLFGPTNPDVWSPPFAGMKTIQSQSANLSEISVREVISEVEISNCSQRK